MIIDRLHNHDAPHGNDAFDSCSLKLDPTKPSRLHIKYSNILAVDFNWNYSFPFLGDAFVRPTRPRHNTLTLASTSAAVFPMPVKRSFFLCGAALDSIVSYSEDNRLVRLWRGLVSTLTSSASSSSTLAASSSALHQFNRLVAQAPTAESMRPTTSRHTSTISLIFQSIMPCKAQIPFFGADADSLCPCWWE